ncbi:MAG: FAD-dependent oxidoreductase, partial [Deinococcota bacterium]
MTLSVAIIGGGFYGCSIACHLAQQGAKVHVYERASELLTRASYGNQARLHGGYHYPRSFSTAYRSRYHFDRFQHDFAAAVERSFTKLYAIASVNSKVTARQFERFCEQIQAPLKVARPAFQKLFSKRLIDNVYEVQEYAFDAAKLRTLLTSRLAEQGVKVMLATTVTAVQVAPEHVTLQLVSAQGELDVRADVIINCTYAGLNRIPGLFQSRQKLKHELTELALVELPEPLKHLSVTVMDGPFFSFMPFPDRNLNTLTHVRYTPHTNVSEQAGKLPPNPYELFDGLNVASNATYMLHDVARFMPDIADATYKDSLFEIKTVLQKNEGDDGRPILFEVDPTSPRVLSILGSKLDNIYDAHAAIDAHLVAH